LDFIVDVAFIKESYFCFLIFLKSLDFIVDVAFIKESYFCFLIFC